MLVHIGNAGQIGNSFLSACHLVANAIEYDYPLISYSISHYGNLFGGAMVYNRIRLATSRPMILGSKWSRVMVYQLLATNLSLYKLKFLNDNSRIVRGRNWDKISRNHRELWLYAGWSLRDFKSLNKHQSLVKEIIGFPNPSKTPKDESRIFTVAVHVRHGDYKFWNGGQFYFETPVYLDFCQKFSEFKNYSDKRILFKIFSNEKLSVPEFIGNNRAFISSSPDPLVDLKEMSKCDLIIGPPSTFSRLASLMGDVPIISLEGLPSDNSKFEALTYLEMGLRALP